MELPQEFVTYYKELLGEEAGPFFKSLEQSPKKGIRANRLKVTPEDLQRLLPEEFKAEPVPYVPDGFFIDVESRPGKSPHYYTGLYYPQEPSAMTPAQVLPVEDGELVLDLCAAPGGKSTQIAAKNPKAVLISNEIHQGRAEVLASNLERMGVRNAVILNERPERLLKNFEGAFDKILIDAPCSGEGMFRKDEDVITEWSPGRVKQSAKTQAELLEICDRLLKPGGQIVYSTCTFEPVEDEEQIEAFVKTNNYEIVPTGLGLSKARPEFTESGNTEIAKASRVWPHLDDGEGHFIARLKKEGEPPKLRRRYKPNPHLKGISKRLYPDFADFRDEYLAGFDEKSLYTYENKLYLLPEGIRPEMLTGLHVVRPGLLLGEFKTRRFEPSHALAMSLKKEDFSNVYELEEDELWRYLKGEEIEAREELKKGWVLMCYQGHPVGFGKYSGKIKNHYPKGLRIRKK